MIKKALFIVLTAGFSIASFAQTANVVTSVPTEVSGAFARQYPDVTSVTWKQEGGFFQPVFKLSGKTTTGYIDAKGHYIQNISPIAKTDLPAAATTYIQGNYAGAQIGDCSKIDFPNGLPSRYLATVNGKQLLFYNDGTFIHVTASILKQ